MRPLDPLAAMWRCLQCDAPNPASRDVCYACGRVRDAVRSIPTPPISVPIAGAPLPHFGPSAYSGFRPAPRGWTAEFGVDSRVVLRRTLAGRICRDAAASVGFSAVMIFVFGAIRILPSCDPCSAATGMPGGGMSLMTVLAGLAAVAAAIWVFGVNEEITAETGRLTLTKGIGGRIWQKAAADPFGFLIVETRDSWDRGGPVRWRSLRAEAGGRRWTLENRAFHHGLLLGGLSGFGGSDDVSALAGFLAEVTGWKVIDPGRGQF